MKKLLDIKFSYTLTYPGLTDVLQYAAIQNFVPPAVVYT